MTAHNADENVQQREHRREKTGRESEETGFGSSVGLDAELTALREQVAQLRIENARLLRLLELTPQQARLPDPVQTGIFDAPPGFVHAGSPPASKVRFFQTLFAARTDVYALRWENARSGERHPSVGEGVPPLDRGRRHGTS